MKRALNSLLGALLVLSACQKKPDLPSAAYEIEVDPDRAFQAAVGFLQGQGFTLDRVDSDARVVTTAALGVSGDQLREVARLGSEPQRYEMGRLTYGVTIEDRGGASRVLINLKVDGFFRPKQTVGGGNAIWQEESSNGKMEKELVAAIK